MTARKLLSLLLALAISLQASVAFAAKRDKDGTEGGKNIIQSFGSFQSEADLKQIGCLNSNATWNPAGVNGTGGCIKVSMTSTWGYAYVEVPNVIGETYDISFYAKVDKGTPDLNFIPMFQSGNYWKSILASKFSTEWKKYTVSYTCTGVDSKGNEDKTPIRLFNTRCGNGKDLVSWYLDELSIVPRGNVGYDWDSWMKTVEMADKPDVIPANDGFAKQKDVIDPDFKDADGSWAKNFIDILAASGYVAGNGAGEFLPDGNITRAEFVKMVMNVLRIENSGADSSFADVTDGDWYAADVVTADEIGLIGDSLKSGGLFKPDLPVNREEAADIFARALAVKGIAPSKSGAAFADEGDISDWAKSSVERTAAGGVICGYPDGTFKPKSNITRAEATAMMYRFIETFGRLAVYVDGDNGSDANDGTAQNPVATLEGARSTVRPYLKNMQNHIYIFIKGGTYEISEKVTLTDEDSGQNGYNVIYTSFGNEKPVFSGGRDYKELELYDAEKNIYRVYVGSGLESREAYFNGVRGVRAKSDIRENYVRYDGMFKNGTAVDEEAKYICDDVWLANLTNQSDIEAVYFEKWSNPRCKVESISVNDQGKCEIKMNKTSWDATRNIKNTGITYPIFLENAYELLDTPGEWYMNKKTGYLYYMPRAFENPENLTVTLPLTETSVLVTGADADNKAHNIVFDNLAFKYFTWFWPNMDATYGENQANAVPTYVGDGRTTGGCEDAALILCDVAYVDIKNCTFAHMGGAGINFREIYQKCNVVGNEIYDLSATGINLGVPCLEFRDTAKFVKPVDYKYFRIYNNIANNSIHDYGVEYRSSTGICASWLKQSKITHNEIYSGGHCGITTGWGWNMFANNGTSTVGLEISDNYIHTVMPSYIGDGGAFYNLGATGGSEDNYNKFCGNYIENVLGYGGAIYPDEGSTYWEIFDNVIDLRSSNVVFEKRSPDGYKQNSLHIWTNTIRHNYVHDNYSTTDVYRNDGADSVFEEPMVYKDANWPQNAVDVINNAGLDPEYAVVYPDSVQSIRINDKKELYNIKAGDTFTVSLSEYRRKQDGKVMSNSDVAFYSSNKSAAVVSADGVVTGVGSGNANIYAEYLDGDVIRRAYAEVLCDDRAESIKVTKGSQTTVIGAESSISAVAITENGYTEPIDSMSFTVEDPTVVSASSDGTLKGVKFGKTKVTGTFRADDKEYTETFDITVIAYAEDGTAERLSKAKIMTSGSDFFNPARWTNNAVKTDSGGVKLYDTKFTYYDKLLKNEAISFDLTINNPNDWPSIAIGAANTTQDYRGDYTYLIGFKPDYIELQRFNSGKRTMIFGSDEYSPVGGPGYPNVLENGESLFEYGKRYSVTVGAFDEKNGVRIILTVNGKTIFDYVDTSAGYTTGKGYFGVYAYEGDFTLEPHSDKEF